MTAGILWKDKTAYLLVSGGCGEYDVINGSWELFLNEETLEGYCNSPSGKVNLKFDKFTYIDKNIKDNLDDYNAILNRSNELGISQHTDIDVSVENQKHKEYRDRLQKQFDEESATSIPF